jgi:hypothetical protein
MESVMTMQGQAANSNPNDPTGLAQFRNDGTTSIASGGYTEESQVKLEADISDPDGGDTLQLHIDFNGDDVAECSSSAGLANPSTNVQVTCSVTNPNSYDWRARTEDNNGAFSNWVAFAGSPDFTVDQDAPASQSISVTGQTDTSCDLSWSATDGGSGLHATPYKVVYQAGATPPTNTDCTNGTVWQDWTASASGTHSPLSPSTQYSYRACFRDALLNMSTATTSCTTVAANNDPTGLAQFRNDGTTSIASGGTTDQAIVKIKATVTDADSSVQLQVEIIDSSSAYAGTPNCVSPFVADGTVATASCSGLSVGTAYKWQARTNDGTNTSSWVAYGGSEFLGCIRWFRP